MNDSNPRPLHLRPDAADNARHVPDALGEELAKQALREATGGPGDVRDLDAPSPGERGGPFVVHPRSAELGFGPEPLDAERAPFATAHDEG
ncbi:MAG TPA: hypothetical protein RMH85_13420 [Polyangiaceae bacterium LLY-WYZ-15_(1-7)]|nr:hypothetical protein [Myxococcales bacterium]MAT27788.1 hypothetical protein [Sandaracinus sp.]HJK93581.1 hypothetical protein [Polyangiaceae bacterium LLY-WYZ-15_(1-7)]MBJ75113.1 hypothetical protein [Sandaracinus sp.]HJL00108.1 hypothetical protein [Polyangiaceae bacterium LLY-WYZ-15_(1-7)]